MSGTSLHVEAASSPASRELPEEVGWNPEEMMRLNKVQHIVLVLGIALFGILVWIEPVIRLQLLAVAFATGAAVYLLGTA